MLSSVLFVLAMPPSGINVLGWFCLVPALLAVRKTRFAFGFLGGVALLLFAGFLTTTGLLYRTKWWEGETGWNYLGFAIFGLAIGGVMAIYSEKKLEHPRVALYLAAAAVLGEAILLLYLPAHLALTQYNNWPVVRIASIGGIWMVSFFVWLANLLIAEAFSKRNWMLGATACAACLAIGFLSLPAPTGWMFQHYVKAWPKSGFRVALIQTEAMDEATLRLLNQEQAKAHRQLSIWPELAGLSLASGGDTTILKDLAKLDDQIPFITSFETKRDDGGLPYNTASLFTTEGESERYAKRKPFGGERNERSAGSKPLIVNLKTDGYTVPIGMTICFDTCFPHIMRELANSGEIWFIASPTLDPIGRHGSLQAIHASYLPFRAAEMGIPIGRADITAWSMAVDHTGQIQAQAGIGTEEVLRPHINIGERPTFYKSWGDWWLYVCGVIALIGLGESFRKGKQEAESERKDEPLS